MKRLQNSLQSTTEKSLCLIVQEQRFKAKKAIRKTNKIGSIITLIDEKSVITVIETTQ